MHEWNRCMHACISIPRTSIAVGFKNAMPLRHIFKIFFLHPEQPPPPFVSPQSSHSRTLLPLNFSTPHKLETFLLVFSTGPSMVRTTRRFHPQGAKFLSKIKTSSLLCPWPSTCWPILRPALTLSPIPRSQFDHFAAFQNRRGIELLGSLVPRLVAWWVNS